MKVYVSVDAEGLPGIVAPQQLMPGAHLFDELRKVSTNVVTKVIDVLKDCGVDEIVVADSHGSMLNIDYLSIPRGVSLIRGFPRPLAMITGLDSSFSAALFIGYHSAAGTAKSVLDHTYSSAAFHEVRICGKRVSEFYINALVAGEHGVPVALVAGDDKLCKEVREVSPSTICVELKKSISRYSASSKSLSEVLEELSKGVREAMERVRKGAIAAINPPCKPIDLELVFRRSEYADIAEEIPGGERIDAYTVRFVVDKPSQAAKIIEIAAIIAAGIDSLFQRR